MELTEPDCMIKRVISADNVMETGLARPLYWGESLNSSRALRHIFAEGETNKDSDNVHNLHFLMDGFSLSHQHHHPYSHPRGQRSSPYKPSGLSFCHTVALHNSRVVPLWQFIAGSAARFSDRTISPPGRTATGGDSRDSQLSQ